MEYRINKYMENDKETYIQLWDRLDEELKKNNIPTTSKRVMMPSNGIITINPFPLMGNASALKRLGEMPGFIRSKKYQEKKANEITLMISAHFNGLALLTKTMQPEDTIIFIEKET